MQENTPKHYKTNIDFDVIDLCQNYSIPFTLGNVIKYLCRSGKKENESELKDLNKSLVYINREIDFITKIFPFDENYYGYAIEYKDHKFNEIDLINQYKINTNKAIVILKIIEFVSTSKENYSLEEVIRPLVIAKESINKLISDLSEEFSMTNLAKKIANLPISKDNEDIVPNYYERINDIIHKYEYFKENNVVPKSENIIWLIDQLINIKWKIEPKIFPNPECTQNEYGFTLQWDNKNDMISCEITFYDEENKIEGYFHNYNIINKNSTETYLDLSLHLSWNMLNNMVYNLFTLKPSNEYNNEELKEVFLKLKEQWLNETCFSSNSKVYTENHNYKEIIKLGKDIVPFIIDEFLSGYYNFWFDALEELTGHSCFKEENRGKVMEQANEWIKWYKTIQLCKEQINDDKKHPKKFIYKRDFVSNKTGSFVRYNNQINKYIVSEIDGMIYTEEEMLIMKDFFKEYIDEKKQPKQFIYLEQVGRVKAGKFVEYDSTKQMYLIYGNSKNGYQLLKEEEMIKDPRFKEYIDEKNN